MEHWKHDSPIVISTQGGTNVVVDKWVVLGFVDEDDNFQPVEKRFDLDTYRVLVSFLRKNLRKVTIQPYVVSAI